MSSSSRLQCIIFVKSRIHWKIQNKYLKFVKSCNRQQHHQLTQSNLTFEKSQASSLLQALQLYLLDLYQLQAAQQWDQQQVVQKSHHHEDDHQHQCWEAPQQQAVLMGVEDPQKESA
jgi:hypothetical protein